MTVNKKDLWQSINSTMDMLTAGGVYGILTIYIRELFRFAI